MLAADSILCKAATGFLIGFADNECAPQFLLAAFVCYLASLIVRVSKDMPRPNSVGVGISMYYGTLLFQAMFDALVNDASVNRAGVGEFIGWLPVLAIVMLPGPLLFSGMGVVSGDLYCRIVKHVKRVE